MMALRVIKDPRAMQDTAHARIVGAEINGIDPGCRNRGGAHRTWLKRDPQGMAGQAFGPRRPAGRAQGQNFSMGGRIVILPRLIARRRHNPPVRVHDNRAHRHLAARRCLPRLIQRLLHM